jgi:hypothetical protein
MSTDEVAERLGRLCPQAAGEALEARARRYGAGAALERLAAAVRSGATGAPVTAELDALDDAFARNGIDGLTRGDRGYEAVRGAPGHPVVTVWACPAPRPCTRLEPREPDGPAGTPLCSLTGDPLTLRRYRL